MLGITIDIYIYKSTHIKWYTIICSTSVKWMVLILSRPVSSVQVVIISVSEEYRNISLALSYDFSKSFESWSKWLQIIWYMFRNWEILLIFQDFIKYFKRIENEAELSSFMLRNNMYVGFYGKHNYVVKIALRK